MDKLDYKISKKYKRKKFFIQTVLVYILLIAGSSIMIGPFIWMLSTSLKEKRAVMTHPPEFIPRAQVEIIHNNRKQLLFTIAINGEKKTVIKNSISIKGIEVKIYKNGKVTEETHIVPHDSLKPYKKLSIVWKNYLSAWKAAPFGRYYFNSIFVAVCVTLGQVLTSSLAAYAFARLKFPGRDILFFGYLATMMIPGAVTMIPNFILLTKLNWIDTYYALILPCMFTAYGTFLLRQFFLSIPTELEESAFIDGASKLKIYWHIIMPLSKPALATLTTFVFIGSWNNLIWPLIVINSEHMRTLPLWLAVGHSEQLDSHFSNESHTPKMPHLVPDHSPEVGTRSLSPEWFSLA